MKNPLLFLDPETAHQLALMALKTGIYPRARQDAPQLKTSLFDTDFANPIGLSAGADKHAEALKGWQNIGFGFVEVGTVTKNPRSGNPRPRIWRFQSNHEIVNWLGLPGPGYKPVLENIKRFRARSGSRLRIGVSIGSPENVFDDYAFLTREFAPHADYIALNASCPNLGHGASADNQVQKITAEIDAAKKQAGETPLFLKLGPSIDKKAIEVIAGAALEHGINGFIATNTLPHGLQDLIDSPPEPWPEHKGAYVGGYSGPQLLEISTFMISELRRVCGADIPLIGVGGVQSGDDALRLFKSGANLIQLYTGLIYKGPALLRDIKAKRLNASDI